jgi:thiaminase/transcriptional activator TenA
MSISRDLIALGEPLWEKSLDHPFLAGIGDGTLDHGKFQFYMVQDYLYLLDYARLFALGTVKAPQPEDMRCFAGYVQQILNGEMDTHRGYMARLGITPAQAEEAEMAPENQAYVDYMLARGWEGGPDVIAVAIFACALSYEYLARRLLERYPRAAEHPFYGEWVASYASDEYAAANREICALLDRLADGASPRQIEHYRRILLQCTRHEEAFWDMAWRGTC